MRVTKPNPSFVIWCFSFLKLRWREESIQIVGLNQKRIDVNAESGRDNSPCVSDTVGKSWEYREADKVGEWVLIERRHGNPSLFSPPFFYIYFYFFKLCKSQTSLGVWCLTVLSFTGLGLFSLFLSLTLNLLWLFRFAWLVRLPPITNSHTQVPIESGPDAALSDCLPFANIEKLWLLESSQPPSPRPPKFQSHLTPADV